MNGIPYHDVAEGLYYLAPGGKQLVMLDSTLNQPNGLVGTPDGKQLYVAEAKANSCSVSATFVSLPYCVLHFCFLDDYCNRCDIKTFTPIKMRMVPPMSSGFSRRMMVFPKQRPKW